MSSHATDDGPPRSMRNLLLLLLHGPAGPPDPMASSALKISEQQARPHLVYVIEAQFQNSKRPAMSDLLQPA